MKDKFVLATDCEKMLGASFTGYNSKAGDLMTIRLRDAWDGADPLSTPSQIHTALHYVAVIHISESGTQFLE